MGSEAVATAISVCARMGSSLSRLRSKQAQIGKAIVELLRGIHAVEDVVEVVRIASHHGSSETDQLLRDTPEHRQTIALGGVAGQLMELVGDGVVEEIMHVPSDVFEGRYALDLALVGLPERGVDLVSLAGTNDLLAVLEVVEGEAGA
jgi:hypothetical protein